MESPHILIIDDDDTVLIILEKYLKDGGFQVTKANDAFSGMASIRQNRDIRLIISDINMPGMTGIDMLEAIKNLRTLAHIPILMLTTDTAKKTVERARELGACGFMSKPFKPEALIAYVKKIIDVPVDFKEQQKAELVKDKVIMLVSDDPMLMVKAESLEEFGYSLQIVDSGEGAVQLFKDKPNISMIITGLHLADMDAYQLCWSVHQISLDIPVICVAMQGEEQTTNLGGTREQPDLFLEDPMEALLMDEVEAIFTRLTGS